MGKKPSPVHSIERKNNGGNYTPDNCVWATRKAQARNRRTNRIVTFQGQKMSLAEAAERAGVDYESARKRLDRGETIA